MSTTTRQALDDALRAHLLDEEITISDEIPTNWVIIGAAVGPVAGKTTYWRVYADGEHPSYVTLGLLEVALAYERNWLLDADAT